MIEDWLSTEWPLIVFVFLLYVFYIVAFLSGRSEARKVISERAGAVRIAFKASAKQQDNPDLTDSNAKGKLSLATQTKDLVILFDRSDDGALRNTYVINRLEITSIQMSGP